MHIFSEFYFHTDFKDVIIYRKYCWCTCFLNLSSHNNFKKAISFKVKIMSKISMISTRLKKQCGTSNFLHLLDWRIVDTVMIGWSNVVTTLCCIHIFRDNFTLSKHQGLDLLWWYFSVLVKVIHYMRYK